MKDEDLIRIRNMLTKIVTYIDSHIISDKNGCLHDDDVVDLSTMGTSNKKYKCLDCGKIWEEKYEQFFEEQLGTLGDRSREVVDSKQKPT